MREQRQITDEPLDPHLHEPTRPGWLCTSCGIHWPCEPYRNWVLDTFSSSTDRAIHMAGFWQFAIIELPRPDVAGDIHRRFLGWTRQPVEVAPPRGRPPGGIF